MWIKKINWRKSSVKLEKCKWNYIKKNTKIIIYKIHCQLNIHKKKIWMEERLLSRVIWGGYYLFLCL